MDDQPYATTDFSLAVTLATLGIKPVNHDGQIAKRGEQPEWREITTELLDEFGITLEEAERRGLGEIAYGFAMHPMRAEIIQEFRKARARFDKTDTEHIPDDFCIKCECGKEHTAQIVPILATFAAFLFGTRKYLADRRKRVKARLRKTHSSTSDGERIEKAFSSIAPKDL